MRAFTLAVTGLALGVTACSSGGTSVVYAEKDPVASISLVLPASSLMRGQTSRATATPRDATGLALPDRPISWQSSATSIATVDGSGLISAVAAGTATISATSEGVSAQASMSVMEPAPAPVASVSVALAANSLNPGQTAQATATARDANDNVLTGRAIAWTSSNPGIATVSITGLVTAVAVGSTQITATSEGQSGNATLTVTSAPPVPVATVSVSLSSSSLNPGQTTQATATTRDANNNVLSGRTIAWTSSNQAVATVSASGLVTAVAVGTAQIIATCEGQSGNVSLTVASPAPVPVASVTVALDASSLSPGLTTQARATTRDASGNLLTGRSISWSSNPSAFATVSSAGLVTAVAVGSVQITASSEGQSGSATLNVQAPPPPPTSGLPNEPAGMTVFTDRAFNAINEDPAWDDYQPGTIVQDPTAPRSAPNVWRATYPAGFAAGSAPNSAGTGVQTGHLLSYHTIYMAWWMKYSSNWYSNPVANKVCYLWAQNNLKPFFFATVGTDLVPYIYTQGWLAGGNGQPEQDIAPNLVPSTRIVRGQWTLIEIVAVGNSAGTANGTLDWYVNGVHVGTVSGVQYTSGSTDWYIMDLAPVWGGVVGVVPATQTMDIDHFYISGRN